MGLTELNGKLRYIQYCRQLKTYGVTFFLVKEKMKGKNKLVPRLLGNHHLNQELLLNFKHRVSVISNFATSYHPDHLRYYEGECDEG